MLDPAQEVEGQSSKPLYIERTVISDQTSDLASGAALAYDQNRVQFEFALLSHFRESATRYRTQMVGLEAKPTPWATDAGREFSYLPDGAYVFKVWGRDYAGNISGPIEFAFRVRPAPRKS